MKSKKAPRRRVLQSGKKPTGLDTTPKTPSLLSSERQTLELIAQGARLSDVLDRLCRTIDALAPGATSTLWLAAPDGKHLELGAGPQFPPVLKSTTFPQEIGLGSGSCGAAAFLKQRVIVSDITTDSTWSDHDRTLAARHGLRAAWSEPLLSQDGTVVGVLTLYYAEPRMPETGNLELIETAAHLALIAIQLDRSRKSLEQQETRSRNQQRMAADELDAYKEAVEGLEEMIVVVDRDYRYVLANRAFLKIRNLTREQVLGRPARDVLNPGVFDETIKHRLDECFRGAIVRYEMKYTYPEIGERDVAISYFPIEGVNGIDRAACIFSDITERKRGEALQAFERFLFDLSRSFLAIPEDSIDANMTLGLARVGEFLEMDRVTLLELSGDRTAMTVAYSWSHQDVAAPPPVLTQQMQPWWLTQVLRGEASLAASVDDLPHEAVAEKEYLRQRGVASAASIPLTVSGEIAGAISFVTARRRVSWTPELVNQLRAIGDILWNALKRRQAMQALLAAREDARDSEERFRLIANSAPVMIWMSDVDKQVIYVNQRWLDFTGWPPGGPPGHRWIELIHPDDVERCGDVYVTAFNQRQSFEVEHRLRRHDGAYRWTITVGVPRYRTDRTFAGYVGTAVDVTDRKLVEQALLQSHTALQDRTAELERRTKQLSRMASDITLAEQRAREELARTLHDGLQQLLVVAGIHVESHMLREMQGGTPANELVQAKHHLDEAIAAARSLSVELFPPVLHILGLPAAMGWLARWSQNKYGLEVTLAADPRANSDRRDVRTLLFESVRELLFNVVKHAHVNRVSVDLALGVDNTLGITVTDEGVGFDPMVLDERTADREGGWGLFSMRERLMLLGGRLEIESVPGHGSRFRLLAPRDSASPVGTASPPDRATVEWPIRSAADGVRPHVLRIVIADDHPALRKTFRELLEARPEFQVVGEAVNGLEAIAQAHVLRPHVILMDVSMPEMDGIEATRRIRAELPFIQIFGFSIHSRIDRPHAIELAGAKGFFTKGIDTLRLIDHLLVEYASLVQLEQPTERPMSPRLPD